MKNLYLVCLLAISTLAIAQTEKMYIMKDGVVIYDDTAAEIDSIIFYEPDIYPQTMSIAIDGNIADWDNIPWRYDLDLEGDLLKVKAIATEEAVYLLLHGTPNIYQKINNAYMDVDNDPNTGDADGFDAMQLFTGFSIWGLRERDVDPPKVGWDYVDEKWVKWNTYVDTDNATVTMEWKLEFEYAKPQIMGNFAFNKDVDHSQFAKGFSDDSVRVSIRYSAQGNQGAPPYYGQAPSIPIKIGKYLNLKE